MWATLKPRSHPALDDGKHVTRVGEANVGALPEGAVFSADGSYLYVGNFIDSDCRCFV
jgi:hypothetical protein